MDSDSILIHLFSLLIKGIGQTHYKSNFIRDLPVMFQGNQNKKYLVKGNLFHCSIRWKI